MPQAVRSAAATPQPAADDAAAHVLRRFRLVFNAVRSHFQQVDQDLATLLAELHVDERAAGIPLAQM